MRGFTYQFIWNVGSVILLLLLPRWGSCSTPYNRCKKYVEIRSPFLARRMMDPWLQRQTYVRKEDANKLSQIALIEYAIVWPLCGLIVVLPLLGVPVSFSTILAVGLFVCELIFLAVKSRDCAPAIREYQRQQGPASKGAVPSVRKTVALASCAAYLSVLINNFPGIDLTPILQTPTEAFLTSSVQTLLREADVEETLCAVRVRENRQTAIVTLYMKLGKNKGGCTPALANETRQFLGTLTDTDMLRGYYVSLKVVQPITKGRRPSYYDFLTFSNYENEREPPGKELHVMRVYPPSEVDPVPLEFENWAAYGSLKDIAVLQPHWTSVPSTSDLLCFTGLQKLDLSMLEQPDMEDARRLRENFPNCRVHFKNNREALLPKIPDTLSGRRLAGNPPMEYPFCYFMEDGTFWRFYPPGRAYPEDPHTFAPLFQRGSWIFSEDGGLRLTLAEQWDIHVTDYSHFYQYVNYIYAFSCYAPTEWQLTRKKISGVEEYALTYYRNGEDSGPLELAYPLSADLAVLLNGDVFYRTDFSALEREPAHEWYKDEDLDASIEWLLEKYGVSPGETNPARRTWPPVPQTGTQPALEALTARVDLAAECGEVNYDAIVQQVDTDSMQGYLISIGRAVDVMAPEPQFDLLTLYYMSGDLGEFRQIPLSEAPEDLYASLRNDGKVFLEPHEGTDWVGIIR